MSAHNVEESSPLRGLHALAPLAWRVMIALVVLLAIYVAAGRYLMTQMPAFRDPLLERINARLPFRVQVDSLSGSWNAFSPELLFTALKITQPGVDAAPIVIGRGSLRLDVPSSLMARSLQLSRLEVAGLALDASLTDNGEIEIPGFRRGDRGALRSWLENFLPNVERVSLKDNQLRLATPGGSLELVVDLLLARDGNDRHLQGRARGDTLSVAVSAEGVGSPLRPRSWTGDIFVDAQSSDLAALSRLWDSFDLPFRLAGAADAQFWLTRDAQGSTARMRWDSQALQLDEPGGAWSLPLDALSFEAALDQRARHWSLLTEDFHIERGGQALDLNRAQFDWWGQALRIRASELGLDSLPTLLAAAPGLPQGLRDALPDIAPQGNLRSVELRLDDLADPAGSWQLRSSVEDLRVGSWRNTPALTGVSGYLEFEPGSGRLQLDAQNFSMHYPTVYRDPLRYTDALGNIRLHWDAEGLRIDSGLMQLEGEEGTARGLFAVDIPFAPRVTGVELELLIGLQDSKVQQRGKYLPYKLPGPLLDWLDRSLLSGDIARGGFIWRGSTLRGNTQHKSLQLFLDARNATLRYDPAWPDISELDATVWIDDGLTWGRAEPAMSNGARLSELMVRVMPEPGGALLDVAGSVQTDAAVAGGLLNNAVLGELTRGVFADWDFTGPLNGTLALTLPIRPEPEPPRLSLDLNLAGVAARVAQVDLLAEDIHGVLHYDSSTGFTGSELQARALGGPLTLTAEDGAASLLDLAIVGEFEAASVTDWLQLPLLNFVSGGAPYTAKLTVDADAGADFSLTSELLGAALDVPRPFAKTASQPLALSLQVPLTADPVMALSLGERLHMQLDIQDGGLQQLRAKVGGRASGFGVCNERLCLQGSLSSLDIAAWGEFYSRYVVSPPTPLDSAGNAISAGVSAADDGAADSLSYSIDSLKIGDLRLAARRFGRARIDLWGRGALWQGALESASLQGSLTRKDGDIQLLLEYLDLDRFGEGEPVPLAEVQGILPSMRVDILELRAGDDNQLLGNVGFFLDSERADNALYFTGIEGSLMGLRLDSPQPGMLRWSETADGERTALELDTAFDDLGAVMTAAGFAPTLESEEGEAHLRLRWPGPPSAFDAARAAGSIDVAARNGRVLESRPGALSMISFLNFAEILRGLSISHMFETGIPFITASTELYLRSGVVEVKDLHIDGAASAFAFSGVSDLVKGSVQGELLVTLPVANNLPWVAALAAGPAVAAGVFVVSKVFEKQVNRMSSAVYEVSGDLQSPDVAFRRLFDDKLTRRPEVPEENGTDGG